MMGMAIAEALLAYVGGGKVAKRAFAPKDAGKLATYDFDRSKINASGLTEPWTSGALKAAKPRPESPFARLLGLAEDEWG